MNQISSHYDHSQQQLALEIFAAMDSTATSIVESGEDFHLKKSTMLVDVSDVGLLARRVLNGVYFLAQSAPDVETHTYDLRYFKWLINYANSNNNTHLKRVIREAQKSAVQVNTIDPHNPMEDTWLSVPMLGATAIKDGKIIFRIPAELRPQLRDPDRHAFLSMRILAGFSSIYALELYERLSVFKEARRSPWWTIDEFRTMIKVDGLKIANDFRYFRRDILVPAVEQINEISDISVTLELRRTGRSYSHISFTIASSSGTRLLSSIADSKVLYDVLVSEFGLSEAEIDEISSHRNEWPDERIMDAVEFVRHRCSDSSVRYPGKYLMKAIRDGYRVGSIEKGAKQASAQADSARQAQQRLLDDLKERSPVSSDVLLPEGEALDQAWHAFVHSTHGRFFKNLPTSFDLATTRQVEAFKGFLTVQ